jgi:ribosome-interacting GTPase 1
MAANLTPQYKKAEEEYRRASTPEEELAALTVMLREMPKHKSSEKLQSELKQKISKVKKEIEAEKHRGGKKGHGVRIPRQGAGTAIVLGGPNAGKSQLVRRLTRATPEVAPYPFTTHAPTPGMMSFEDVMVQLIDTPPVTKDFCESYMQGLIRAADLALLMLDLGSDEALDQCQDVIDKLNSTKTRLAGTSRLDEEDVGLSYTQTFLVANKIDLPDAETRLDLFRELCPLDYPVYKISAEHGTGLEELRGAIYGALDVVRVYSKLPAAKTADLERPFTIRRGHTILEMAALVHKDFVEQFKFARVWGSQVHDGTVVKGDYIPSDRDIVELHM